MRLPFYVSSKTETEQWRIESFWYKEPETIQFIKDFKYYKLKRDPVFVDIGANIGMYTLYAASLYNSLNIIAIEPDNLNYQALCDNIAGNRFKNILPLPIGMSDNKGIRFFTDREGRERGTSGGQIIPSIEASLTQSYCRILTLTVDLLFHIIGHIDFIKIDVDGHEYQILFGLRSTINYVSMVLVEMDTRDPKHKAVIEFFKKKGFTHNNKYSAMPNHSRHRRISEGIGHIENFIFTKI